MKADSIPKNFSVCRFLPSAHSLQDVILHRLQLETVAGESPDGKSGGVTWIGDRGEREVELTLVEFHQNALAFAHVILNKGNVQPGSRVDLVYPPGVDFLCAFVGCLYAGVVPVPIPPLNLLQPSERRLARFAHIINQTQSNIVLTSKPFKKGYKALKSRLKISSEKQKEYFPAIKWLAMSMSKEKSLRAMPKIAVEDIYKPSSPKELAYISYNSVRHGMPRGVMVSHGNYLHQMQVMAKRAPDILSCLNWIPFDEPFGLVHGVISPFGFCQGRIYFISPTTVLRNPSLLLSVASTLKVCMFPVNEALLAKLSRSAMRAGSDPDLSCVKFVPVVGPVVPANLGVLLGKNDQYKLDKNAVGCCFTTAEAVGCVACFTPQLGQQSVGVVKNVTSPFVVDVKFECEKFTWPLDTKGKSVAVLSRGYFASDMSVAVVDKRSHQRVAPGTVGELWVEGPSVSLGYWNDDVLSKQMYNVDMSGEGSGQHKWLRTNQFGFVLDGQVYVVGAGEHIVETKTPDGTVLRYSPEDVEQKIASCHPMAQDCVLFSITSGEQEVRPKKRKRKGGSKKSGGSLLELATTEPTVIIIIEVKSKVDYMAFATTNYSKKNPKRELFEHIVKCVSDTVQIMFSFQVKNVILVKEDSLPLSAGGSKLRFDTMELFVENLLQVLHLHRSGEEEGVPGGPSTSSTFTPGQLRRKALQSTSFTGAGGGKVLQMATLEKTEREEAVKTATAALLSVVRTLLESDPSTTDLSRIVTASLPLQSVLDSVKALELKGVMEQMMDCVQLPAMELLVYSNVASLAEYLVCKTQSLPLPSGTGGGVGSGSMDESRASPLESIYSADMSADPGSDQDDRGDDAVPLVGLSCRFPRAITDPMRLWSHITSPGATDVEAITVSSLANHRWNMCREDMLQFGTIDRDRPGSIYESQLAFLHEDVWELFDKDVFHLTKKECGFLSPEQRLSLQLVWEAFYMAGFVSAGDTAEKLNGAWSASIVAGGVTLSALVDDQDKYISEDISSIMVSKQRRPSSTAEVISNVFGFSGPAHTVDSGCVSSMSALNMARNCLLCGDAEFAMVVSTQSLFQPLYVMAQTKLGMISERGRSLPFDDARDGFLAAEAGVGVLLATRAAARAKNLSPLAHLRAVAVAQSGRRKLEINPVEAQERCILNALYMAGVESSDVCYVEPHGTGSKVGDGLELRALMQAYGPDGHLDKWIMGSSKAVLGHSENASGLANLVVAVLSLHHGTVPGYGSLTSPDALLGGSDVPCMLSTGGGVALPSVGTLLAGIHCYGMGGHIAHAVIEVEPGNAAAAARLQSPYQWDLEKLARYPLTVGRSTVKAPVYGVSARQEGGADAEAEAYDTGAASDFPFPRNLLEKLSQGRGLPPVAVSKEAVFTIVSDAVSNVLRASSTRREAANDMDSPYSRARNADVGKGKLHPDANLGFEGMTSVMALEIHTQIQARIPVPLKLESIAAASSISAIVANINALITEHPARPPALPVNPAAHEPVSVVGMACRLPCANSMKVLWKRLLGAKPGAAVGEVGSGSTPARQRTVILQGGRACTIPVVSGVGLFDSSFFGLDRSTADFFDPHLRLLCEVVWESLLSCGFVRRHEVLGLRAGVFIGNPPAVPSGEYLLTHSKTLPDGPRLAEVFGFVGPSMSVDDMSTSGVSALSLAMMSLRARDAFPFAVVGSANLVSLQNLEPFLDVGMVSSAAICRPFGKNRRGVVPSDGAVVLLLARGKDAADLKMPVYGQLHAAVVRRSQASDAAGLLPPSPYEHQDVMHTALKEAGVSAADVGLLEAMGAGTPGGDIAEYHSIEAVYGKRASAKRKTPIVVGTHSAVCGFPYGAQGLLGVLKAIVSLHHGLCPPSPSLADPDPALPLPAIPAKAGLSATPLQGAKYAAVHSFSNRSIGHVIVSSANWKATNAQAHFDSSSANAKIWQREVCYLPRYLSWRRGPTYGQPLVPLFSNSHDVGSFLGEDGAIRAKAAAEILKKFLPAEFENLTVDEILESESHELGLTSTQVVEINAFLNRELGIFFPLANAVRLTSLSEYIEDMNRAMKEGERREHSAVTAAREQDEENVSRSRLTPAGTRRNKDGIRRTARRKDSSNTSLSPRQRQKSPRPSGLFRRSSPDAEEAVRRSSKNT